MGTKRQIDWDSVNTSSNSSTSSSEINFKGPVEKLTSEEQSILRFIEEGTNESSAENTALGSELLTFLTRLGLDPKSLSNDVEEGLQKVSTILQSEGLTEMDETALRMCREQRRIEERKLRRKERSMKECYDNVCQQYVNLHKKLGHVESAVNSLESEIDNARESNDSQYSDHVFYSTKLHDYSNMVNKLQKDLQNMNIEDIRHDVILSKHAQYIDVMAELMEVTKSLNKYKNLPPNLLQAKAALASKEQEFATLKKLLEEKTS